MVSPFWERDSTTLYGGVVRVVTDTDTSPLSPPPRQKSGFGEETLAVGLGKRDTTAAETTNCVWVQLLPSVTLPSLTSPAVMAGSSTAAGLVVAVRIWVPMPTTVYSNV